MNPFCARWHVELDETRGPDPFRLESEPGQDPPATAQRGGTTVVLDGLLESSSGRMTAGADLALETYERRGLAGLADLRGRFSLVVWDPARGELIAGRDPMGVRPMFHCRAGEAFLASPHLAVLLDRPGVSREVDPIVTTGYLIIGQGSGPTETPFSAIRRVPPGHMLRVRNGSVHAHRTWEPRGASAGGDTSEAFAAALERAVARCQGEGRFGILLSGGIDSATVAAAAAVHSGRAGIGPPTAISMYNRAAGSDEASTQQAVAGHLGLSSLGRTVEDLYPTGGLLKRALDVAADTAWPPGITQPMVDEMIGEARDGGAATMLAGQGGDEWLSPSPSWAGERLRRLDIAGIYDLMRAWPYTFPWMSRRQIARHLLWHAGARALLRDAATPVLRRTAGWGQRRERHFIERLPTWLLPDHGARKALAAWFADLYPRRPAVHAHRAEKSAQLTSGIASGVFEDLFVNGRRVGVEFLCPMLDTDVITVLINAPVRDLVRGGRAKAPARDYLAPHVPFAEQWPPKTIADHELGRIVAREREDAWDHLGGLTRLDSLGVVDSAGLAAAAHADGPGAVHLPALWDIMALESWLRTRTM